MRRNFMVVAVLLMFGAAASLAAQAKPDFSGKWVMDPASAPAAPAGGGGGGGGRGGGRGGGGAGFGQEFTATQDAKMLTITRMQGDQTITATYNLDGSESKNTVQGRGGAQLELLRLLDERVDHVGLAAERRLLADEGVGCGAGLFVTDARPDGVPARRQLVEDAEVQVAVQGKSERARDGRGGHHEHVRRRAAEVGLAILDVLDAAHRAAHAGHGRLLERVERMQHPRGGARVPSKTTRTG